MYFIIDVLLIFIISRSKDFFHSAINECHAFGKTTDYPLKHFTILRSRPPIFALSSSFVVLRSAIIASRKRLDCISISGSTWIERFSHAIPLSYPPLSTSRNKKVLIFSDVALVQNITSILSSLFISKLVSMFCAVHIAQGCTARRTPQLVSCLTFEHVSSAIVSHI